MSSATYDCLPCPKPSDDELRTLRPRRPVREPLSWYVHIYENADGIPVYERRTHGNYTDRWFRLVPAAPKP